MKNTNWRGLQAYGCKNTDFRAPGDVNIRGMSMGSWHMDLAKGGKYIRSKGGLRKHTGRGRIRTVTGYKGKTFNPVVTPLPQQPDYDRNGWRIS